jgi:hypothetical protein
MHHSPVIADAAIGGDHTHLAQQRSLINRLRLGQRSLGRRARLDRIHPARPVGRLRDGLGGHVPTAARAQGTLAPAANMAVCTATPSSLVCGSRATIEYVTVSPPDSGRACCPRGRQDCHQAVAASRHIGQKTCGDGTETEWRADGSGRGSMPGGPTAFSRIAAPS